MLNLEWIAFFKCFCWTNRWLFIVKMNHLNFILPHPQMLKIELDFKDSFNSLYGRIGVFIIHRYITFINKSQSTQSSCVAFKWMEFPFSRRDKKIVCLANIIQTPEIVESEFFKFIRILYILSTFWNLLLLWSGVNFFYIKICSGAEMSVCL